MTLVELELKKCPFCAGGETRIEPNQNWTGMRYKTYSYTLKHNCVYRGYIELTRNTENEVVEVWNSFARE
ncbi:hypothetical protein PQZ62_gp56 [Klebsiella phage MEW1]|uniref:Uncharacterized protein n=1 Tax=Klebsiella phage MEW1 TaxID=2776813 RepID=A0A7M1IE66_9CAUD|nr:hypothetical protein PQZ62_gp56 [Klebsiella phage MEW1]QOQ37713.1 hypothetical protein MEW1_56 [Klebsiella phage MEW1]